MEIDVTINLGKIRRNLTAYTGQIILMVKADAYGHGLQQVARAVDDLVCGYGVATVEEGMLLRECTDKDVLVCQWSVDETEVAEHNNLTLSVTDFDSLDYVKGKAVKSILKANTGMNRFGFDREAVALLKSKLKGVAPLGVYSHVYSPTALQPQRQLFNEFCELLCLDGHLLSSHYNHVPHQIIRVGIGAYEGAMTVTSRVVAVRKLKKGDNVGYGNVLERDGHVAWVFGGYADGICRERPQPMMIGGQEVESVAVCMDSTAVFTGEYRPKVGDEVVLVGQNLTINKIAQSTLTTPYTVMTCWRGRVKRTYRC